MRWVRSNRRFASWLALFAFALQLTSSFGHLHLDARINKAAPSFAAALGISQSAPGGIPDQPIKHTKFADFCAICAVIHMASSSLITAFPSLPLPDSSARERMAVRFDARLIASPRLPSQPRAPPAA
jgi:hypothetical protein